MPGNRVKLRRKPYESNSYTFHRENGSEFMIVGSFMEGKQTFVIVECEDEHIFHVRPMYLEPV